MINTLPVQAPAYSAVTVEMQPYYYRNYDGRRYGSSYCCDPYRNYYPFIYYYCNYNQCDNYFEFCVRSYGSTSSSSSSSVCTYGRKVTPVAGDDAFSFPSSYIGVSSSGRIDNPMIFTYTGDTVPTTSAPVRDGISY